MGSHPRPPREIRVSLLPLKILIVLIFVTIALSLVVSVQIHSLDTTLDTAFNSAVVSARSSLANVSQLSSTVSTGDEVKRQSSEVLEDPERRPLLKILRQAGYNFADTEIFTPEVLESIPRWSHVVDLYGEPVILGLETCQQFRDVAPGEARQVGVAGMFNSGTNILNECKSERSLHVVTH